MASDYEIMTRLDGLCRRLLTNTKNKLYLHLRYLSLAFSGLEYAMSADTATVGTDGYHLWYSPLFLMQQYQENDRWMDACFLHMIFHCLFAHPVGRQERQERLWNLCCDIAAEHLVDGMELRFLGRRPGTLRRQTYYTLEEALPVLTPEAIYRYAMDHPDFLTNQRELEAEFLMDDHSFWVQYRQGEAQGGGGNGLGEGQEGENNSQGDGQNGDGNSNQPGERPEHSPSDYKDKWANIAQQTQMDLETMSPNGGEDRNALVEYLRLENRVRYDYGDFLRKFMVEREVMQLDLDSYDYIYYTYGLQQYGNMPLIESLEYAEKKKVEEFVIVIDTSASCDSDLVKRFLEETVSIFQDTEQFFRKINVHIIQCDNQVQKDDVIVSPEELNAYIKSFEVQGRGGTDFSAAFRYVDELCAQKKLENLKGLLYFTDGYGTFPEQMPPYETAFVFVDDSYAEQEVPPWAMEIVLGREELERMGGSQRGY